MKIIIFDRFLGYNIGGAQKSLHFLIEKLISSDEFSTADFSLLGCEAEKTFSASRHKLDNWQVERIKIMEIPWLPYFEYWLNRKKIKKFIEKQEGDILISQGRYGAIAIRFFKGKKIYFIRSDYNFGFIKNYFKGFKRLFKKIYLLIQSPFIRLGFKDNEIAIKESDLIISNSKFISDKIKNIFNRESEIIYPIIDVKNLLEKEINLSEERGEKYITIMSNEGVRGVEIFKEIANIMPSHKFRIVGRGFERPYWDNNIFYTNREIDAMNIYKKAKIVLMPSIWEEAFGRVAVESLALSIPCIGSNIGGIPEILPEKLLIHDIYNISEWKDKILDILKNYNSYCDGLRSSVLKFDSDEQIDKFKKLLADILSEYL